MDTGNLALSWSVSHGRDTDGYNICRLDAPGYTVRLTDGATAYVRPQRYKCLGGGYDMVGTVIGEWLQDRFQTRLLAIRDRFDAYQGAAYIKSSAPERIRLYGAVLHFATNGKPQRISVDGSCGFTSMEAIAEAIGVKLNATANRKGHLTGYVFLDYGSLEVLAAANEYVSYQNQKALDTKEVQS